MTLDGSVWLLMVLDGPLWLLDRYRLQQSVYRRSMSASVLYIYIPNIDPHFETYVAIIDQNHKVSEKYEQG